MGPEISLLTLAIAVVAGILGSLLGLGGGVFIIPASTLILGASMHEAIGASIVSVIAASSGAALGYVRSGLVNVRLGSFLELATTSGALAGAVAAAHTPGRALAVLFAVLLTYSAYSMFQRRDTGRGGGGAPHPLADRLSLNSAYYDAQTGRPLSYGVANVPAGFGVMWGAGIVSGLLGIGSGLLNVLGMDTIMRLPIKVSTATSNFMIGVTAAASAGYYFSRGLITPELAVPVAIGVLVGARSGSLLMPHLAASTLRRLFIPVLLFVAAAMLLKGVQG